MQRVADLVIDQPFGRGATSPNQTAMRWRCASTRVREFNSSFTVSVRLRPANARSPCSIGRIDGQRHRPDAGLLPIEHERLRSDRSQGRHGVTQGSSATLERPLPRYRSLGDRSKAGGNAAGCLWLGDAGGCRARNVSGGSSRGSSGASEIWVSSARLLSFVFGLGEMRPAGECVDLMDRVHGDQFRKVAENLESGRLGQGDKASTARVGVRQASRRWL